MARNGAESYQGSCQVRRILPLEYQVIGISCFLKARATYNARAQLLYITDVPAMPIFRAEVVGENLTFSKSFI